MTETTDPSPATPSSEAGEVLVTRDDAVVTLTINRPEKRNALTWEVIAELRRHVAALRTDDDARVLVLAGAGDQAFCAGADLSTMADGAGAAQLHEARGELAQLFLDLYDVGKPTIAKVQGYALAGGFGLALSCDFLIASERATFGTPEINVGLWPFMITVPMLRSMPPKKALELMMTGRRLGVDEAVRTGFVNQMVAHGQLDETVTLFARQLANKPAAMMRLGRDSFYAVLDHTAEDALRLLHPLLSVASDFEDAAEGRAAFVEKRPPEWTHR
jgi:enoyl-CoA hydratase/carnithine racemase